MTHRLFTSFALAGAIATMLLVVPVVGQAPGAGTKAPAAAQAPASSQPAKVGLAPPKLAQPAKAGLVPPKPDDPVAKRGWTVPRTPDGQPDLQGTWNLATLTPMERSGQAAGKEVLTEAEAAAIENAEKALVARRAQPSRPDRTAPPKGGDGSTGAAGGVGGYNNFWIDRGSTVMMINGQRRTAIIVDPPDGRVPALTPEARKRNLARANLTVAPTSDTTENAPTESAGAYDHPELRPLGERCLLGFGSTSGPPTLPNYFYNNLKQIVQTKDYVMILVEMVHDARIIPLNRPHAPASVRKWMGDSVGHWEGDTLVVDTTNFTDKTRFRGSSENLHVIERFTRVDADTILYRFTVDDPATWTRPWTGEFPWEASSDLIYEYACHEANYALGGILRGARLLEKEAAEKKGATR